MGLLGSLLGGLMGGNSQAGGAGALINVVGSLLANNGAQGGLGGLVEKFNQAGAGDLIGSWIGSGQNSPISGDQLSSILGSDAVSGIAKQLGLGDGEAAGQLAQMLPGIIDKLTPNGQAPEGGLGNLGDLAGMLGGLLNQKA